MNTGARNILVIGPSWVGDMVMSAVLYRYLWQTRPGVAIDVLAPAWSQPLLQRMPEVRSAIVMPVGHGEGLGRRWRLGRELRLRQYDQALLLPNSLKSALVPAIAAYPAPHRLARRDALWPGQRPAPAGRTGVAADGAAFCCPGAGAR